MLALRDWAPRAHTARRLFAGTANTQRGDRDLYTGMKHSTKVGVQGVIEHGGPMKMPTEMTWRAVERCQAGVQREV